MSAAGRSATLARQSRAVVDCFAAIRPMIELSWVEFDFAPMPIRQRKSSARVTLVLFGAAALAACGQEGETLQRDLYASKEDCVQDWGDELKCEKQPPTGYSFGLHSGYW